MFYKTLIVPEDPIASFSGMFKTLMTLSRVQHFDQLNNDGKSLAYIQLPTC